jgi:hypothetical protein
LETSVKAGEATNALATCIGASEASSADPCVTPDSFRALPRLVVERLRAGSSLVGNKGYHRYLKLEGSGHFVIDEKQVKAEKRFR